MKFRLTLGSFNSVFNNRESSHTIHQPAPEIRLEIDPHQTDQSIYADLRTFVWVQGHISNIGSESRSRDDDSAAFLNRLWSVDEKRIDEINGQFRAIRIRSNTIDILSDPFGTHPIYYSQLSDGWVLSDQIRHIQDISQQRRINPTAIRHILHFGHMMGHSTLINNILTLPPATHMRLSKTEATQRRYMALEHDPSVYHKQTINDVERKSLVDRLIALQLQSVDRESDSISERILPLSGGLDSRWLLAIMSESEVLPKVFTMGYPDSDDVRYARQLANIATLPHESIEIQGTDLWHDIMAIFALSDGMTLLSGALPMHQSLRRLKLSGTLYAAQFADMIWGSTLQRNMVKPLIYKMLTAHMVPRLRDSLFRRFHWSQFEPFLTPEFAAPIQQAEFHPFPYLDELIGKPAMMAYYTAVIQDYARRGIMGGNLAVTAFHPMRMPSFDRDLLQFALSVPLSLKFGQELYRAAFCHQFPAFAKIPKTSDHLPISADPASVQRRILREKARSRLQTFPMIGRLFNRSDGRQHYADYPTWMGSVLVEPMLELFSGQDVQEWIQPSVMHTLIEPFRGRRNPHHAILFTLIQLALIRRQIGVL